MTNLKAADFALTDNGVAQKVDLFLDDKKIGTWTAPPYETTIPYAQYTKGNYLRATAIAWPLIIRAPSDARKRHVSAISSGWTKRAIDWPSRYSRSTCGACARRAAS